MAKKDALITAQAILDAVGGAANVASAFHCATRLRLSLHDATLVQVDQITAAPDVAGYFEKNGQHQVILGTGFVNKVYKEFNQLVGGDLPQTSTSTVQVGKFQALTKAISDIFIPIIPVLLATGILMGLQGLVNALGVAVNEKFTLIFNILTGTAFTFIPVLVCSSAAKKFGGDVVIATVLGLMLVSPLLPNKWEVVLGNAEPLLFDLGITTISIMGYQSSVIPALVLGIFIAKLEQALRKFIPDVVDMLLVPFLALLISLLVGLFLVGPVLLAFEQWLTDLMISAVNLPYGIFGFLYGGFIQMLCAVGMHHSITPIIISMYSSTGLDYINPMGTCAIAGQLGAGLALVMMNKDKTARLKAIPALTPALFGISEPVMYGLTLPKIKPFLFGCVAGGVGGGTAAILGLAAQGTGASMFPGILLYLNQGLLGYLLVLFLTISVGYLLTRFFYHEQ